MDLTMFGEISQQDTQAEGNGEQFFDNTTQRWRALCLTKAFFAEKIYGAIIGIQDQPLFQETCSQLVHLQACYSSRLLLTQRLEDYYFVYTIEKFGTEGLSQAFHQLLALHLFASGFYVCTKTTWH